MNIRNSSKSNVIYIKKNDDSNHETSKNNICRTWKKNMLNCYFNVSKSSDLIFIENCWQKSKQWIKKISHWNDEIIKHLIIKNWKKHMFQRFINERNKSMFERLRDVIRLKNQMIEYWTLKHFNSIFHTCIVLILTYTNNNRYSISNRYALTHARCYKFNLTLFNSFQKRFIIFIVHESHFIV